MMDEKKERAIIIQDFDVKGTALEIYGGRPMVKELTARLMGLHPAAREVGEPGMLAVAQLAILVGANPLPSTNEIHVWADNGRITIDLGINYFRRRSNELGGIYWVEQPRVMSAAEYDEYGVDPRQMIGSICKGVRLDKMKQLLNMGLKFEQAVSGNMRIGIGTVSRSARPKQGRPLSWTALKAAEKDVCRELFPNLEQPDEAGRLLDIVPKVQPSDAEWPGETLTTTEIENLARLQQNTTATLQNWDAMPIEEQEAKAAANDRLLNGDPEFEGFGDEPQPKVKQSPKGEEQPKPMNGHGRPLDVDALRQVIRHKAGWQGDKRLQGEPATEKQVPTVAMQMNGLFPNLAPDMAQKARHDTLAYLLSVTSTKDLTKREASALLDWTQDQDTARIEAARILEAIALDAGQQKLEL